MLQQCQRGKLPYFLILLCFHYFYHNLYNSCLPWFSNLKTLERHIR